MPSSRTMVARLPRQHFLLRPLPLAKIGAALAVLVLLVLAGFAVYLGLWVSSLDIEFRQVFQLQTELRRLKDETHAERVYTDNRFHEVRRQLREIVKAPVEMEARQ